MKIAYNPKTAAVITTATAANDDILFDLNAKKVWAKGLRMGADWADISSKPSSLKNPHALTISLNGTSQGPYDGSAAKNINITPGSIGAATSGHNHDGRYVRKWTGAYGSANKFLKLVISDEKGWIRLEVSDSNNALSGGYGIYIIGWGYHGDNGTDTLTVRCLYANDSRYTTALKVVRTSRNNYDFYFQFASGSSYPSYTINYSNSGISIDYTVTAISTIPTATWTSSLSALQLNASQVDWSGITNKPSEFNPAAHTHTVFKNNLMIKGTNGISDSASIHLGIGDSDTGFKWISDGKCQIYANNSAVGEWTSGGMNWFKNPTVNGNKIWNAGNDGSGSGLDADLLDGWHLDSIRKNVGYSWSAKYRINNWSRIIKIDNYSNILLVINFLQNGQASNHLYLISTGYDCGNIVQLGANGFSNNSAIKIRLTKNTEASYNVEIYSTYGYNGATELSINCNYTRIDGNSTITTYLTYTAGGGTVKKEITSSYSKIVANLQGNSDTTTKLQTPRQINGTNFDGSANITTSYWGTTRTLTIGNSGKSVNGSADISWSLSEIGAADVNHTHDDRYLKLSGGTMIGQISSNYSAGTFIVGCTNAILKATANGYNSLICAPIKSGNVCISAWTAEDNLNFGYAKKGKTENNLDTRMYWDAPNNNLHAAAFTGHLYGTADNATKLQTARNLWGNSFDGTKDINGSIVFPNIGDTATSNKISWSGSSDGADIYYQTTAKDQGNLVLNVKDDTNAYIQLALNGTFKSHFDVANSYWTGRSAQADKWTTARTFTIGNTAKNVDGSGNVSWSLAEIGVKDTWRTIQVNGTSIGNNTLNLCGSTYIGLTNVNGKVTFSLVGSGTTANQAILSNGTANGWTLKTLNIANWDAAYNLRHSHANKSVLDGITSGLVTNWNTAYTFVSTITGTDTDKVINKWDEIVNFLAGITEDNKLNTLLNSKLSVYELADNTNVGAIKNNGIYYSTTDASSRTLTNSPFNTGFALINMTSYDGGDDLRRSRLAFNAHGEIKISDDRNQANTAETWYNVLTSKNSGINGSTIKLNGTSITVYSSSTADGRYVKKSGDTMTGALNFANNTWNQVGDDVAIGDHNVAGCLGIKGLNASPGLAFYNSSNTLLSKLVGTANQFQRVSGNNVFNILDTSSTYTSNGKGVINGTTITQVDNATNSTNSTNARKLVNWYSSRPTSLNTQFGDGSLRIFYATSSTTEGKPAEDSHILHLAWDNNGGWDAQLAVHTSSGKVSTRAQNSGTWQPWKTLAFTTDIPSSLPANGGNADTVDGYHASGLLTALSNSNRGISLTVGGTTKSLSNISVGDADTVDRYHANTIYNAPSFMVSNGNTSNTYILLATITISGTSLSCAEFTTLFQNRECLDSSSFILSGAIRRDSPSNVRATLSYVTLHTGTPRNIYLRSDDGVTFRVYIQSAAGSWTTYYRAIPIVDSGNITYSNTGTTSPISGSVLNIAATKGGNVNYASSAGSANTATKLTSSAGNAALPIYFSDGKPVACTASSVFSNLSNSGNNLSITVAGQNRTLTVGYATSAGSATKVIVTQHTNNDINYPLVWSNQSNANNATENQLFKSWQDLYYNPKNKRLFVKGSVSTANINATGTVTSAGFKHSSVTENADQYVLTADGGYTFLNQTSNELAHEFSKDITVTSEWADIEDFYGGNQNFLTQPGTYIVQVYYNDNSANGMYEGYFSGIMSWFTKTTNSNNADEIVLHRVGHSYANTIYLRTRESLESETNPYTKLQISANSDLKQHTYKFKFKRIC